MGRGFAFSIGVHALVLLLILVGLPFFHPKRPDITPMITVDVVDVAKDATTNRISPENKVENQIREPPPQPPKPQPQPQPAPHEQIDTTIPKLAEVSSTAPDLTVPEVDLRKPLEAAPKLADVDAKVAEIAEPTKMELKRPQPKVNFDAVLKNLAKLKPQDTQPQPTPQPTKNETKAATGAIASLSDKLTQSEMAALNDQLKQCWLVPAGVKDADKMVVPLDVEVNPDRTVASVQVEDQSRMSSDPAFRAAAMAAVRAVRNPNCSPLALPPDKYETWKSLLLNFDPKAMLG
ncbi:MAG TPA: hypothetical protein VKZ79_21815 [Alphaproteobacteria bacterium]|nr:hypothetical protein [Alphaproteobacteria bacterium]